MLRLDLNVCFWYSDDFAIGAGRVCQSRSSTSELQRNKYSDAGKYSQTYFKLDAFESPFVFILRL